MRTVHLERFTPEHAVVPLCGRWRFLDEDWTDATERVTCPDCRLALRAQARAAARDRPAPRPAAGPAGRPLAAATEESEWPTAR